MRIEYPDGATPLDQNEIDGLLLPLRSQAQLNAAEQQAIFDARLKVKKSRIIKREICTVTGLFSLHREMFAPVWSWAGTPRRTEKSIGIAPHQIQIKLKELCLNTEFRIKNLTNENWPELAAYFHHALVLIHPFSNGNGRHGRFAVDVLSWKLKQREPVWGSYELEKSGRLRSAYLNALQEADRGNVEALIAFMFTS